MKKKDILAIMAVAMMAGGCSSIDELQSLKEPVPIRLTTSVGMEAVTRGADGKVIETDAVITRGIQEDALVSGEKVYVWANKAGGSSWDYLKAWTLTADGSMGLSGSIKYYPADGTAITMNAVHGNFSSDPTEDNTSIGTLTHSIVADQSATGGYEKSDLLFGTATGSKADATKEIPFKHMLSKIEVNLTAGYGYTSDDLATAEVHLNNVKPSITIDATDGTLGASASGSATTITTRKTGLLYEAVIPPQTFANPDALIAVTTTKDNLTLTSTVPNDVATYADNTRYVYNVTVNSLYSLPDPQVGDYFYADGTWSTTYENTHGDVVGLVFSTNPSTADRNAGYTHGYVVSLTNIEGIQWSTSTVLTGMGVLAYSADNNTWMNAIAGELDGLSHTNYIRNNYASYATDFPAFYEAVTYNVPVSRSLFNNSGWYLPSIGQLYTLTSNFCNKVATWPNVALTRWAATSYDGMGYYNQTNTASGMNSYFNQRLNTDITNAGGSAVSYSTWRLYSAAGAALNYLSSTEYNADYAYFLHYGGGETLAFLARHTGMGKTSTSSYYFLVRPVLAF